MLVMISVFIFIILVLLLLFFSRDSIFKCNHDWIVTKNDQHCKKCGEYQKLTLDKHDNLVYFHQWRKK